MSGAGERTLPRAKAIRSDARAVLARILRARLPMRRFRMGTAVNWRYALGELSLIVAGVLIALAANSWWEERTARHREGVYLRQLLADVRETERRLATAIATDSANLVSVNRFLDAAEAFLVSGGSTVPSMDSLELLTAYSAFTPMTGTYTALLQNGGTQILRSDSIRFHLTAYAATIMFAQEVLRQSEAQTWRNQERANLGIWRNLLRPAGGGRWRDSLDVRTLLQDSEVLNAMTMQRSVGENRLETLRGLREPIATLRRLLEVELRRR